MKIRHINFGLLILLAFSLQVRFALAAQNWCPWMQASMAMPAVAATTHASMPECEGMSDNGTCHLQPICTAVPIASPVSSQARLHLLPEYSAPSQWVAFATRVVPPPARIPIF
jgi:hypothetical protein